MMLPLVLAAAQAAASMATPPAAPTLVAPTLGPGYAYTVASVYLRRTPSYPGPVIDELKIHTRVKVVACSNAWCELDLGSRSGVGYLTRSSLAPASGS